MKSLFLALGVVFTGCATNPPTIPVTSLSEGGLHFSIFDSGGAGTDLRLEVSKVGEPEPNFDDCVRLADTTSVTINGIEGQLVNPGGYDRPTTQDPEAGGVDYCENPHLRATLADRPATVAIIVADPTAQLEIDLALRPEGDDDITRCDAAGCSMNVVQP